MQLLKFNQNLIKILPRAQYLKTFTLHITHYILSHNQEVF